MSKPNGNKPQTALAIKSPEAQAFELDLRRANAMAAATMLPKHLRGGDANQTAANCLMVINQANIWKMSPWNLAMESYEVHGRLGYQGKLIAGVVNKHGGLKGRLRYEYAGDGDDLTCTVIGQFADEDRPRESVGHLKTERDGAPRDKSGKNPANVMWLRDPRQKLAYTTVLKWARLHAPELVTGVAVVDEHEANFTRVDQVAERLGVEYSGDPVTVTAEPDETGEIVPDTEPATPGDKLAKEFGDRIKAAENPLVFTQIGNDLTRHCKKLGDETHGDLVEMLAQRKAEVEGVPA